jgi:hypothetical protein
MALAGAIALWVGSGGLATADSLGINFEAPAYHAGSIQGQQGWAGQTPPGIPINPAIDQAIVVNGPGAPASFGGQSWRISNAYTSGSFGDMPFSPSLQNEAGETLAQNSVYSGGTRQNHFVVQWAFASADPAGPGTDCSTAGYAACSYVSMAPDRGDGARMSYIRLEDDTSGLRVFFDDYQDKAPYGSSGTPVSAAAGCGPEDNFVETMVASGLNRAKAHTVALSVDFVDGPRNDVVKVFVDGQYVHTGTSWEDYFRWCTESGGGTGTTADQSRTVDSMIFTVRGGTAHPLNLGKGFLIDNLAYSSSTVDQCDNRHADGDGDVQDGSGGHAHMKFHKDGCGKHDGDNVQHDDGNGHSFQSSSVDSAQYSTAANGRTVAMTGTGLDNGVPVAFTLIAIDHDGLVPATYSLVLSDGYSFIGTLASGTLSV